MKKKYTVNVTLLQVYEIEADSEEEALTIWYNGQQVYEQILDEAIDRCEE